MKKRTLALIMAVVLMLSVAIPGTLAVSQDSDSTTATLTVDDPVVTEVPATETPVETESPVETEAPVETEVPVETATPAPETTEAPVETEAPETTEAPEATATPIPEATEAPEATAAELVSIDREAIFDPAGVTLYADIGSDDCVFVDLPDDFTFMVRYEFTDEAGALWYMLNTEEWADYPEYAAYPFITEESIAFTDEMEPATLAEPVDTKPNGGSTTGQPFSGGTGGSTNFRIPALITLSNGNLLAAADARWETTLDGYGLDTIVSYSGDSGATWKYSFANYFGDSNGYDGSASAFIDPVLVQGADGAVYLFADLYPGGGHDIANIQSGTGFVNVDDVDYLALYSSSSATSSTTPAYYVANALENGYYTVYDYSTHAATDYVLDAEYNIYTRAETGYTPVTGTQISGATTIKANVFYTGTANPNGPYVLGTEYIVMRKGSVSADGSIVWGDLRLLNVKNSGEYFYGVGPGGGITTSTGRIIVPLYTYANGSDGKTSVIYSDDNGATWTRSADVNVQTSEASISEVRIGGTNYLYMFTRHGGYFVSSDNGTTWSAQRSVSGISYTTTCELSTLTYSKYIDGCPAILLSAPTSNRTNGKIFVGLVQSDGSIRWSYTYAVNNGTFQYSDMAELSNGSIGILYENGGASIAYTTVDIASIAPGAQISEPGTTVTDETTGVSATAEGLTGITVVLKTPATEGDDGVVSETYTVTLNGGSYTGPATLKIPCNELFNSCGEFWGVVGEDRFEVVKSDGYFLCRVPHFSDVTIYGAPKTQTVTLAVGQTSAAYEVTGAEAGGPTTAGNVAYTVGNTTTGTYEQDTDGVDSASQYLIMLEAGTSVVSAKESSANNAWYTEALPIEPFDRTKDDPANYLWTITETTGGYYIQNQAGQYMTIEDGNTQKTNYKVMLGDVSSVCDIESASGKYRIFANDSDIYVGLNDAGGGKQAALGWPAADNTQWELWKFTPSGNTVRFTGTHVGTQTVTVGDTVFTVVVTPASRSLTIAPGQSQTVAESGAVTAEQLAAVTGVTASYDDGSLTFTAGETEGSYGPFLLGDTNYTITVGSYVDTASTPFVVATGYTGVGKALTKLTLSVGRSYTIGLGDDAPTGGTWSIRDTAIATVDEYGNVTGVAEGETVLTYTAGGASWSIPVVIVQRNPDAAESVKAFSLHFSEITATTGWYSWNCSGDTNQFVQAVNGEAIYVTYPADQAACLNVYAKPDAGYALSFMSATNSAGQYYLLRNKEAVEDCEFYNNGAGSNERGMASFGDERVAADITAARALDCDGAQGFSRSTQDGNMVDCDLTLRSVKLPTVEKEIVSYTHDGVTGDYSDAVALQLGDTIKYRFTVKLYDRNYRDNEYVYFADMQLTDRQIGYDETICTGDLESAGVFDATLYKDTNAGEDGEYTYYTYEVDYELTESELTAGKYDSGTFKNTVELTYKYKSNYSSGSFSGSAKGAVSCAIVGVVSYKWFDGTPEGIVNNADGKYTLPTSQYVNVGGTFYIQKYTGSKEYTDSAGKQWVYTNEWGVMQDEYGNTRWFEVTDTVLATLYTMNKSRSITFYGRWQEKDKYNVTYQFAGPTPDEAVLPAGGSYYKDASYTVDNSFAEDIVKDGVRWTFQGWKLNDEGEPQDGLEKTMGTSHVTYVGQWERIPSASLTIQKTVPGGVYDADDRFLFTVTGAGLPAGGWKVAVAAGGSVTITGLVVGETYTVAEDTNWSWRYEPTGGNNQTITVTEAGPNVVTFSNTLVQDQWLSGSAQVKNILVDGQAQQAD